jgi:hypothetical protein
VGRRGRTWSGSGLIAAPKHWSGFRDLCRQGSAIDHLSSATRPLERKFYSRSFPSWRYLPRFARALAIIRMSSGRKHWFRTRNDAPSSTAARERGRSGCVCTWSAWLAQARPISCKKKSAMQRLFAFAMILWFAAVGVVRAQTVPAAASAPDDAVPAAAATPAPATLPASAPQSVPGGTSLHGNGCSPSPTSTGGAAAGYPCGSDPLSVPASNASAALSPGPVGASSTGSAVGARTPSSVDPEMPVQLPGERPGTSTQAPNTTASAQTASASAASSAPCSVTIQSATGASGVAGALGGVSSGGC